MPKIPAVLLVDDDPITNFLNQNLLARLGITDNIRVALDGRQALHEVRQHCREKPLECPILILLDINMPVMDGIQFMEAYQQLPAEEQQGVVVIMLTTSVSLRDQQRVQQLPIADYLAKPLTEEKVERIMARHFPSSGTLPGES